MQQASAWLAEAYSRSTAFVFCDCKSPVEELENPRFTDMGIRCRREDKSGIVVWLVGDCNVPDNDLADAEAKAGSLT